MKKNNKKNKKSQTLNQRFESTELPCINIVKLETRADFEVTRQEISVKAHNIQQCADVLFMLRPKEFSKAKK